MVEGGLAEIGGGLLDLDIVVFILEVVGALLEGRILEIFMIFMHFYFKFLFLIRYIL